MLWCGQVATFKARHKSCVQKWHLQMYSFVEQGQLFHSCCRDCGWSPWKEAPCPIYDQMELLSWCRCSCLWIPNHWAEHHFLQFWVEITDREYLFLREYCTVMKPLTVSLDILQGEDNCFYGTLLPTLETLISKTLDLKTGLQILGDLPEAAVNVRASISSNTLNT